MAAIFPELTANGLVLWRVRQPPDRQAWCYVTEFCGEVTLSVHDLGTDDVFIAEVHSSLSSLVERADRIRQRLLAAGRSRRDVRRSAAD